MSTPAPTSPGATATRVRSRAKKACKTCNARRVKCNVMEVQPCNNCRAANIPCELMKSRRGKYERHPKNTANHPENRQAESSNSTASQPPCEQVSYEERRKREDKTGGYAISYNSPSTTSQGRSRGDNTQATVPSPIFRITPPSTTSTQGQLNGADTVFLGESNSISLVHTAQNSSATNHQSLADKGSLRYAIPATVSSQTTSTPFENRRKAARIEFLTKDGAFSFPSNEVCEVLFEAYFSWFHPCFPILDRHNFFNSYITKTISPLLFQAVLFVGASHCNQKVMRNLGYPDRQEARNTIYNRAKDIYDADFETDKITVSQAVFLMSFWRAGPLLEKDTRHWLGAAISLAQTKGMHRSSSTTSFMNGRLRKRIWWSLYVFRHVYETKIVISRCLMCPILKGKINLYIPVGKICLREFAPVDGPKTDAERSRLKEDLMSWEQELSHEMRASATPDSFWASMLHLAYKSAYLGAQEDSEQDLGNIALQAACRNTRIIEDVLSQDLVQHSNVHIAQLCLLGLRELQKTWDVTNWVLQLFFQFLDQSTAKKLQLAAENEDSAVQQSVVASPLLQDNPDPAADLNASMISTPAYVGRSDEFPSQNMSLDFASHLFGSKEAEDFSLFQLQPDLFSGDVFGGGLDQYYNSILPRGDGSTDGNQFR
ncbi:fungal-specific transcription factor domain-containing protein [Halenospora varia]|nr:fungal-specific transcription factor domain-containing protein [Halenospora varia]